MHCPTTRPDTSSSEATEEIVGEIQHIHWIYCAAKCLGLVFCTFSWLFTNYRCSFKHKKKSFLPLFHWPLWKWTYFFPKLLGTKFVVCPFGTVCLCCGAPAPRQSLFPLRFGLERPPRPLNSDPEHFKLLISVPHAQNSSVSFFFVFLSLSSKPNKIHSVWSLVCCQTSL